MNLYLALIHYPVLNKRGEITATSVTPIDLHDISRSAKTFGVKKLYIVTPLERQWVLLQKVLEHWSEERASIYNPHRQDALGLVQLTLSFEDVLKDMNALQENPLIGLTSADPKTEMPLVSPEKALNLAQESERSILLCFGTGHGLAPSFYSLANFVLNPIYGERQNNYNHLSVRSAVAIYLDRFMLAKNLIETHRS